MEIQVDECETVRPDPDPGPGLRLPLLSWKKRLGQGGGGSRGAARTSRKKGKSIIKMEDDQGEASELQRGGGTLLPESKNKKKNLLARANRFLLKFSFKKLKAFKFPSKKQKLLPPTSIQVEKKSVLQDPETGLVVPTAESDSEFEPPTDYETAPAFSFEEQITSLELDLHISTEKTSELAEPEPLIQNNSLLLDPETETESLLLAEPAALPTESEFQPVLEDELTSAGPELMFPAKKQNLLPLTSIQVEKKDLETELLVPTAESESEFDDKELKDERDFYLEKKQKMPMMQLGPLVAMIDLINNPKVTPSGNTLRLIRALEQELALMEKTPFPGSELDFFDEAPVTELKVEVGHPMDLAETESDTSEAEVDTEYESYTMTDTDSVPMLTLEEVDEFMEADPELTAQEKILHVLHLVSCKNLTEYDPRRYDFVCTRFSRFNIALFDLNEESEAMNGPPLQQLSCSQWHSIEDSSLNIISLKITESDVGYPIDVFGTVIARDEVDYKCVSLYRRERDESQRIHSAEDMLTLTGPSRGFAASDGMFFEINLMYKGDEAIDDTQLSKGITEYHSEPFDLRPVTVVLSSWLSRVELLCLPVPYPTAAVVEVKILNGNNHFIGKIFAWNPGNDEHKMLLYSHDGGADHALIGDGHRVTLARNLVAVPIGKNIALHVCFVDHGGGEVNVVKFLYPQEEIFCKHGSYELQLKVEWRSMLSQPMADAILKRWASVPVRHLSSQKLYMSSP